MADTVGFEVLPHRWVVERTLARLNRKRRLAKDFEASIESAETWAYIASMQLTAKGSYLVERKPSSLDIEWGFRPSTHRSRSRLTSQS